MREHGKASDSELPTVSRRGFLGGAGALAGGLAATGLVGGASPAGAEVCGLEWGPRVDLTGLKENFAPQEVKQFTIPAGGIDHLGLHSTDVFTIPGMGEFSVDFSGYFRVARAHPSTFDWAAAEVRVNIVDLRLFGRNEALGEIAVRLNPDILSSGQIFATKPREDGNSVAEEPKACRIATAAVFELRKLGLSVFNKEPILLMNEHITRVPPVDDPSGHALLFRLPLYNLQDPKGEPVAYLTSLRYGADHYLTEGEVRTIKERS
ncbi:MAG TPA: hypothetical protein DD490_04995 [Acidobacteria bacterium]|nr:hypothetical protein [Acidobacteriota bacterium]